MGLSLDVDSLNRAAEAIVASVKAEPLHAAHRVALANVRLLQGQYPKALQQMQVACQADVAWLAQAQLVKMLVQCETARQAVFAGKIQADVFEAAPTWLQWMMQALHNQAVDASLLRQKAMDLAPETAGILNQHTAFDWFADGDERLGPALELYTANRYFWLPVEQVASVEFEPQGDALDLLWTKVTVTMVNSNIKEITGYIPTRYPNGGEDLGAFAFETEWRQGVTTHGWQGQGARIWFLDGEAVPIRKVSSLAFHAAS